jgi:hypothetical protein
MYLRNPTTPAHTSFSWPSTKSMAIYSLIRQAASQSHPTAATPMLLSSTSSTPTQFNPFPSRTAPKKNFFVHIARSTPGSHYTDSNLSYTNLTTKHQKILKRLLPLNKLASNTLHRTPIAQTLPNRPSAHGRIIFLPAWQAFPNLFPSPTSATSLLNAIPPSTCYVCVVNILSSWHTKRSKVLFQCYTHGTLRHRGSCTHETKSSTHMGLSCIQVVVLITCCKSLSLHLSPHGRHRRQEDHQHFPIQASCHSSPGNNCSQQNH